MKFYCVTSSYSTSGRVTAAIVDCKEADSCPESVARYTARADIYADWYGTREEAEQAVLDARNA